MCKRIAFAGFFVMCTFFSAAAQPADSLHTEVEVPPTPAGESIETVGDDLMTIRRGSDDNSMVLEVAGFGITLGTLSKEELYARAQRSDRSRFALVGLCGTEMGFNLPVEAGYGAYPADTEPFFDVQGGKSFHFSTMLVGLNCELGKRRWFDLSAGLGYTIDNFRLSDHSVALSRENGMIVPVRLDEKVSKSKLRITSLGVPVHFSYEAARNLSLSLTGYFDFTVGANSIYKSPKVKNSLSGVNTFRFGIGGSVTYHRVGLYIRYSVTPLFRNGVGPKVRPLSIGLCLGL